MIFRLRIDCDSAAFADDLLLYELRSLLFDLARSSALQANGEGSLRDVNGNTVGSWTLAEEAS